MNNQKLCGLLTKLNIKFANLVAAAEREACAQVAEEMGNIDGNMNKTWRNGCFDVAFAIRERGAP